ncbi:hypothetical protein BKA61DRAFT_487039 [Leptodontidium sp. MPI-SDFR-AT-0119]|nr:hypothetical protein BKA61DRAFT_487039 [Leptodontidium sp. MPI-SDFR-AT-0119]
MASTDKKSKPGLGRRTTFQKMLDLEQKNKINRMRASSTFPLAPTSTPRSPPPPKSNLRQHPPMPLPSIDRAMTAPTLSLAIPPARSTTNGTSTKYVVKSSGDVVPQEEEVSDAESDISSICQSPGWEDYNGKKRKKAKEDERERRRKEAEGTNGQAPQVQQVRSSDSPSTQSPKRLSKAPPTNKRLTKMAVPAERSASAPAVPTLPTMARGDVKKEEKRAVPEKVKRGSIDIGLKGFMTSSQNSSPSTPTQEAPSSRKSFSRKPGAYNDGGFIGGLKLEQFRQTETTTTQQNKHEHKKVGNIRKARRSHPPTSRYFPAENEDSGSAQRDSSNGSRHPIFSGSRHTEDTTGQNHSQSPVVSPFPSPDPQPIHDRVPRRPDPQPVSDRKSRKTDPHPSKPAAPVKKSYPPESRGRADYVRYQRQEEEINAMNALKDESEISDAAAGSKKTRSRRGSFSSLFSRSRSLHDFALSHPKVPERSPARSPARKDFDIERSSRNSTPKALNGNNKRSNHSRSATDSSEDYSTLDESSTITTPSASRPQSQKDLFSAKGDLNGTTETPVNNARNSWCRTGAELELTEDEDRLKTPTGNNSTFEFTSTHMNASSPLVPQLPLTPPTEASDLQRKPSLSRSISTPDLQDLSFLPTLKHQSLTRPLKGKEKATPAKEPKQPNKFLEEAPNPLNGPDPIAKMFVVCCQCKYFHDMPSKIYECMAKPDNVVTDNDLGVSGVISTSVKCPWCGHGMSTSCCAGYAAVVYLREKLH